MSFSEELMTRVAERLCNTPSTGDQLLLTKWRVMSICQYLPDGDSEVAGACHAALEVFVVNGPGAACDKALRAAASVIKLRHGPKETILPSMSKEQRAAVRVQLEAMVLDEAATIEQAVRALPSVRARLNSNLEAVLLPGVMHRLELIARLLENQSQSDQLRIRAAAAVRHIDIGCKLVSGKLDLIRLINVDYLMRVVLKDFEPGNDSSLLHWSERVALLWDDLPLLQGVNLQRDQNIISVTWLDRTNSYVSYLHALCAEQAPLILLQPSIVCSPLHTVVSLIGLLVFDAMTSSRQKADSLLAGQTYAFDRNLAIFDGLATDDRYQGMLRLRFRNGTAYAHPTLADQMVAVTNDRPLSDAGEFQASRPGRDPLRRFFNRSVSMTLEQLGSRV